MAAIHESPPHYLAIFRQSAAELDSWAAIFATELGWMACLWRGQRLAWNSFGFDDEPSAYETLEKFARAESAAKTNVIVADGRGGTEAGTQSGVAVASVADTIAPPDTARENGPASGTAAEAIRSAVLAFHQKPRMARAALDSVPAGASVVVVPVAGFPGRPSVGSGSDSSVAHTMIRCAALYFGWHAERVSRLSPKSPTTSSWK